MQTSANHPLDLRDPEDIPNSRPVEQAALEYRRAVEYFEANEVEIMRRWKSGWSCNKRKERAK
jgi:hypothetical protein